MMDFIKDCVTARATTALQTSWGIQGGRTIRWRGRKVSSGASVVCHEKKGQGFSSQGQGDAYFLEPGWDLTLSFALMLGCYGARE